MQFKMDHQITATVRKDIIVIATARVNVVNSPQNSQYCVVCLEEVAGVLPDLTCATSPPPSSLFCRPAGKDRVIFST